MARLCFMLGNRHCQLFLWKKFFKKTQKLDKNSYDAVSIPGYVIKKNSDHGAKHGRTERQRIKARQCKHGGHNTILERWRKDDEYRKSVSEIGWTKEQIIQYDELAVEEHFDSATKGERTRNENNWVLE